MNAFNVLVRAPGASLQSDNRERLLDLRELQYSHSAARTGNLGCSACELNISQPAISRQMRKLEEGRGTQLLVRHDRGGCGASVELPMGFLSEILGATPLIGDRDERGRVGQDGHDFSLNSSQRRMQRIQDFRSRV